MSDDEQLQAIRERINSLDEEIQQLISQRAEAAQQVAQIKLAADSQAKFYRPEREADVLRKVKARNQGPLDDEEIARLFREIMSACLALEEPMKIAFLGPDGTFTQAAALKHFGHSVQTQPAGSISEVFRDVESGACHYGVVPVENSTEGVVTHTLDMFLSSPLQICGEVSLRINHHLLSAADAITEIETVYAHQQSLAQCRGWLDRNLPHAQRIGVGSNAEAAKRVVADPQSAAIASEAAAEIYGLKMLSQSIEDEPGNTTRFLVIGKQEVPPCGEDKTSLLLATRNVAGSLHRLLGPLAEHGVSMTRIESRPSGRGKWEYVFFVDIDGHKDDDNVAQVLESLKAEAQICKILGSYPTAVL